MCWLEQALNSFDDAFSDRNSKSPRLVQTTWTQAARSRVKVWSSSWLRMWTELCAESSVLGLSRTVSPTLLRRLSHSNFIQHLWQHWEYQNLPKDCAQTWMPALTSMDWNNYIFVLKKLNKRLREFLVIVSAWLSFCFYVKNIFRSIVTEIMEPFGCASENLGSHFLFAQE